MLNFQQNITVTDFKCLNYVKFFLNFVFGLATCWLGSTADSREVASLLPLDREAGVREDKLHRACTWFFRAKARLEPDKSWKDVLDSRKADRKNGLALLLSLLLHASTSPDRIWEWPWSRAMCLASSKWAMPNISSCEVHAGLQAMESAHSWARPDYYQCSIVP